MKLRMMTKHEQRHGFSTSQPCQHLRQPVIALVDQRVHRIWRSVIAQVVTPIVIHPDRVRPGVDGHADSIAQPFGKEPSFIVTQFVRNIYYH